MSKPSMSNPTMSQANVSNEDAAFQTITVTEYCLPNGEQKVHNLRIPADLAKMAEEMILSCEVLRSGDAVQYAHFKDEDPDEVPEDMEISGISPHELMAALDRLIKRLYASRHGEKKEGA